MSARTYPAGEPMRHKHTGQIGTVEWRSPDDADPALVCMVIRLNSIDGETEGPAVTVVREETWDWESLLGPG